jgi:hypothetical protein
MSVNHHIHQQDGVPVRREAASERISACTQSLGVRKLTLPVR